MEPVEEAGGPGVDREAALLHAEAVAAAGVDVEFGGDTCVVPGFVKADGMIGSGDSFVVVGLDEEERWCVFRRSDVFGNGGVNRSGEIGAALRIELESGGGSDVTSGGEANDADAVRVEGPFFRAGADEADGLKAVSGGERFELLDAAFGDAGSVLIGIAGADEAVLENEGGDADGVEPVRDFDAFVVDGEPAETSSGADDDGGAGSAGGIREKDLQRRNGHVGDAAETVLGDGDGFGIVGGLGAGRRAGPEGNGLRFGGERGGGERKGKR